ncbi:hypothetical protein ACQ4M3_27120 [Leptolyngbya sp. AN03gr2]|uniref:hypothetical protein n=1 Tax=unclassified Leptolyngbya TaxID=2650499 RepID=UPI003D3163A6
MNRFWSVASKALGSVFLCGGGVVSIALSLSILALQPPTWALTILLIFLVFFGLTPSAIGGLLLYASSKANRHAIRDRFFQLLHLKQGRISLLDFSRATRLEPEIARRHLDLWAREYDANFEVSDAGEIYYVFSNEMIPLPPASQPFEVVRQVVREVWRSF